MTRTDLIRQVLLNLKIIDPLSNPSAEDAADAGRALDQRTAWLKERGLVWWDADDVPDAVARPLAQIAAEDCSDWFGRPYVAPKAISQIAALKSSEDREPARATYY